MGRDHTVPDVGDEAFDEWGAFRLADVEHDTELDMMVGRHAIRLADGESDEAPLNGRFREAIVGEFGIDDRPTTRE